MFYFYFRKEETVWDVLDNCIVPSTLGAASQFFALLGFNLVFNLFARFGRLPRVAFHCMSTILGVSVMYFVVLERSVIVHIFFLIVGYILLNTVYQLRIRLIEFFQVNTTLLTEVACALFLIYGEFYYPNKKLWLQSRGIAMIAVMKIISLAAEFNRGIGMPGIFPYAGYMMCPANSSFGPWISFLDYVKLQDNIYPLNSKWIVKILKSSLIAFFYLTISNCAGEYFLKDDSNMWVTAYRKALCFRTSHYFVSYMSEVMMVAAGYNQKVYDPLGRWEYTITKPLEIEFPRSLTNVVSVWNIPTHRFLKIYVYIVYLPYGRAAAILITFFFSALLHGMNVEITLVLLSLGGFSFLQGMSQRMLSKILSACVKVYPCINCDHRFKAYHPLTLAINFGFAFLNVIHLTYLGSVLDVMEEKKSFYDTYLKWEVLGLTSHHIFVGVFAVCCLCRDYFEDDDEQHQLQQLQQQEDEEAEEYREREDYGRYVGDESGGDESGGGESGGGESGGGESGGDESGEEE